MRIGLGYDVHAFAESRRFVLGGVEIDYPLGLAGHSDADVLTHAVMDAMLGALREGDIGKLFPDTDSSYRDADSLDLLAQVAALMRQKGFELVDADCVVVLQEPRISPYRDSMRANIAKAIGVPTARIGIKATTTERLGFEGRGEGVAAQAVVLLELAGTP